MLSPVGTVLVVHRVYFVLLMPTPRWLHAAQQVKSTNQLTMFILTSKLDSECRGTIEGNPVCADTNWSLVSTRHQ